MGLFGQKPAKASAPQNDSDDDVVQNTASAPLQGPPEVVRAIEVHRAYWTHNADEQAALESKDPEQLDWRQRLRLHHLLCLQRLDAGIDRQKLDEKCRQSINRLLAADSPYRPRPAFVWQRQRQAANAPGQDGNRQPDLQGVLSNHSLTHFGCIEIFRGDAPTEAKSVDFVSFDALSEVAFGGPSLIRFARLFYEDGKDEIVLAPLLYGLTWQVGQEHDRSGQMTRFVKHLDEVKTPIPGKPGLGVGQQDLCILDEKKGMSLFGIGSAEQISFPLDMRDPRFDEKARARGIDPDEVRRQDPDRNNS